MEQLLKVTSTPLQTIQFSQKARLVPTDSLDVERRKAMARYFAFKARYGGGDSTDAGFISQVNKAFSSSIRQNTAPAGAAVTGWKPSVAPRGLSSQRAVIKHPSPAPPVSGKSPLTAVSRPAADTSIPEPQAAYTLQRGSFELRVAKGELSYIPPLVMTIITQYPEIHFEYTGENYPRKENDFLDSNVDLSI